jgi:hypothetical protein
MSKPTPQERINQHLALMVGNLEHLKERPPRSYQVLDEQRMCADATLHVALEVVCEVLPVEIQPTVKQLLDLRQALWHRAVEGEQEQKVNQP